MRKNPLTSFYRRDKSGLLIDLKLKSLSQIYSSFDPSPFHERDLDDNAADYIEDSMLELRNHSHVKLVIHLPEKPSENDQTLLREAIHNYFAYRARVTRLQLKEQLRFGRISLVVGVLFLITCFQISTFLRADTETFSMIVWEGLIIIGWVMLWRPLDIFLYEWWPLLSKVRLYERLQTIPVEFTPV